MAKSPRFVGVAAILVACASSTPADALEPREQRGLVFAKTNCATCHAVERRDASPMKIAPPFRSLGERYSLDTLARAFAEGVTASHPTMPRFQLDSAEIGDLVAYLATLLRQEKR